MIFSHTDTQSNKFLFSLLNKQNKIKNKIKKYSLNVIKNKKKINNLYI